MDFDDDALTTIAQRSADFGTGARALHSELERVLMPHMFNIKRYRDRGINRVVINKEQINKRAMEKYYELQKNIRPDNSEGEE